MDKDIMYTLSVNNKDIDTIQKIETKIKYTFDVKFIAYDQYELKVSFVNELTDEEEGQLFNILNDFNKN
jgi:hypothetical protein